VTYETTKEKIREIFTMPEAWERLRQAREAAQAAKDFIREACRVDPKTDAMHFNWPAIAHEYRRKKAREALH